MKLLVVEDEDSIAIPLADGLRREGFEVERVASGADALAAPEPDLVLLDLRLPDMDGYAVAREMRVRSRVPIIMVTARGEEVDRVVGLEIGGDDYICKPFSPRELTARVRAVLRRADPRPKPGAPPATNPSPALENGEATDDASPIVVDETRCQIRYFGEVLPLSRYEYRLLQTFARYPGRVFSRAQLMEHASDEPEAAMERTVDAHVKALRAKMKAVRSEIEPIVTHRGLGYSLAEKWTSAG